MSQCDYQTRPPQPPEVASILIHYYSLQGDKANRPSQRCQSFQTLRHSLKHSLLHNEAVPACTPHCPELKSLRCKPNLSNIPLVNAKMRTGKPYHMSAICICTRQQLCFGINSFEVRINSSCWKISQGIAQKTKTEREVK